MVDSPPAFPLDLLKSGQLLYLAPHCQGWLILQKPFFAELIGPGAAVGGSFDLQCRAIYPIGDIQFCVPDHYDKQRRAFHRRLEYTKAIQAMLLETSPLRRATQLVEQLCQWIGSEEAQQVPIELAAHLVGVFPHNLELAWQYHLAECASEADSCDRESRLETLNCSAAVYTEPCQVSQA
jgi:hypothetical protein